jgi:hypothetical protein
MAIKKPLRDDHGAITGTVTMPVFSYGPNDGLAQLIVDAWSNESFRKSLLERDTTNPKKPPTPAAVQAATLAVNAAGFNLQRAVVISEKEHDADYQMQADNEVVFVLPNQDRVFPGRSLLETARLLMACTPNGI